MSDLRFPIILPLAHLLSFLPPRRNRAVFAGFVQPNIMTALPPAGGSGVHGRFIPVFDKELKKHSKYIESPYDAPRMQRTSERVSHEKTLETLHDSKRFSGQVRKKDTFTKDLETYGLGENPDGTAIVMPVYRDKPMTAPLLDKDGQPMAPFYPSNPGKKVRLCLFASVFVRVCIRICVCIEFACLNSQLRRLMFNQG